MELRQNNARVTEGELANLDENPRAVMERWLATREQRVRETEEIRLRAEKSLEKAKESVDRMKRSVGLE